MGAFVAVLIAPDKSRMVASILGGAFLLGGIANMFVLPEPAWFNAVDILLAYIPTAWLGYAIAMRVRGVGAAET
jgi:hypothetical protein